MLNRADNTVLTSTGPGTMMGRLMREYWIPALSSDELRGAEYGPLRIMLLGEKLVAFRDSRNKVGLLEEACPHRGASLYFGSSEPDGLRCAYHGWKFSVGGECLDMPCEPHGGARQRVRARSYPCVERGGIVWAYMGPRSVPPPLPDLAMNAEAGCEGRVALSLSECNWLQNLEGDIDVDHIPVLHGSNFEAFRRTRTAGAQSLDSPGRAPQSAPPPPMRRLRLEVAHSPAGIAYASEVTPLLRERFGARGRELPQMWNIGQFMFPFYAMLPYKRLGAHWVVARVPVDDYHTMTFGMFADAASAPPNDLLFGPEPTRLPNRPDWFGRFRLARNPDNDFGLRRDAATGVSGACAAGSALQGQVTQDLAIVHSMGSIALREREHLGPGDEVIVRVRGKLMSAALALQDKGCAPPGVDAPAAYRMKQGLVCLRPGRTWREALSL